MPREITEGLVIISFVCRDLRPLEAIARTHLARFKALPFTAQRIDDLSLDFLCHLMDRIDEAIRSDRDNSQGIHIWARSGFNFDMNAFIRNMKDFWIALLKSDFDDGPYSSDSVVIIHEAYIAEVASCVEVRLAESSTNPTGPEPRSSAEEASCEEKTALLSVVRHDMKIGWRFRSGT